MAQNDKSEKATPKKKADERKKGRVAKSADINGAVGLLAAVLALSAFGPGIWRRIEEATVGVLAFVSTPDVVDRRGIEQLFVTTGMHIGLAILPILAVCVVAGVLANVGQVGFKPAPKALWEPKKLNPMTGAKNIFGINAAMETVKTSMKIVVVGAIIAIAVFPKLEEMAALVGMPAEALLPHIATLILSIAQRAALAYLVIGAIDLVYQKHRFAKNLRMDKSEIKQEHKQQELPNEIKGAQRRRAMEMSRARMMDAVPTADVVVTNPTHFSVALRYGGDNAAPLVVAKGADHLALRIRTRAAEHGVTVVPDPPLARALYSSVEVGRMIPEELYQAVAQVLAYVYKVAGQRSAAA
jgi:flagellar biosynthetic protein FlhB